MAEPCKVLLVDDDAAVRFAAAQALRLEGIEVEACDSAEAARPKLERDFPGVLVTDVRMRKMDGLELLDHAVAVDPALPVILVTGHGDVAMAVEAMRRGAYDFIQKPFASDHLVTVVRRALEKRALTLELLALRRRLENRDGLDRLLIGQSPAMEQLRRTILTLADTPVDVLVLGETGAGKEMVAQCLHQSSPTRRGPFVAVNCGAIPENMFESEIFGHEAGAFTGAQRRRVGKLEHASAGTLFLDEIESLPLAMQVKLLRALQERKIERLGSNQLLDVDLRVVAATKVDLEEMSRQNRFRLDLYYRLNVVTLELPPLRDRREDVPLLFEHFVLEAAQRYKREAPLIPGQLLRQLMQHDWPGNVRELRNVANRFVLGVLGQPFPGATNAAADRPSLGTQVDAFERSIILTALRDHKGNVGSVADELGVPRKTLYDKIKKHGIELDSYR